MSRRLSHDFHIIGCADALSIPYQIATQIGVGIPRYLLNKWINASKTYDANGRDQFGLNAAGKSEDGQSIHTGYVLY